jgi:hypothetical protein
MPETAIEKATGAPPQLTPFEVEIEKRACAIGN